MPQPHGVAGTLIQISNRQMNWHDYEDIGIALYEKFPEVDPLTIRFTDLILAP